MNNTQQQDNEEIIPLENIAEFDDIELSDEEQKILRRLLRKDTLDTLPDFIFRVLGPEHALLFYELFAGETIFIPDKEQTKRKIVDTKLYSYFLAEQEKGNNGYEKLAFRLGIKQKEIIRRISDIKMRLNCFSKQEYDKAIEAERARKQKLRHLISSNDVQTQILRKNILKSDTNNQNNQQNNNDQTTLDYIEEQMSLFQSDNNKKE